MGEISSLLREIAQSVWTFLGEKNTLFFWYATGKKVPGSQYFFSSAIISPDRRTLSTKQYTECFLSCVCSELCSVFSPSPDVFSHCSDYRRSNVSPGQLDLCWADVECAEVCNWSLTEESRGSCTFTAHIAGLSGRWDTSCHWQLSLLALLSWWQVGHFTPQLHCSKLGCVHCEHMGHLVPVLLCFGGWGLYLFHASYVLKLCAAPYGEDIQCCKVVLA